MLDRDDRPGLVLASGSRTRCQLLQHAGVAFTVAPADIDERALERDWRQANAAITPGEVAEGLARAKAEVVSRDHPNALVLGADQVLALGDEIFDKAGDIETARATLTRLSGREHVLHSAMALAEHGDVTWTHCVPVRMGVRKLSPAAIDDYLLRAGSAVTESVGAYRIEEVGIQLFERVDGDIFAILGLPLLPLLAELRTRGVIAA